MEWPFFQWYTGVKGTTVYNFNFISNKGEVYFSFDMIRKSVISRAVLSQSQYERYMWVEDQKNGSCTYPCQKTNATLIIYVVLMEIVSLVTHLSVNVWKDSILSHKNIHGSQTRRVRS